MDGLTLTLRLIAAGILGFALVLVLGFTAMVVWLFEGRRRELRPWEEDLYTTELRK